MTTEERVRLTAAQKRILAALSEEETLLGRPRRDLLRVGRGGPTGHWRTFAALEDAGLMRVRHGFAVSEYATITSKGKAALAAGLSGGTP